jgi:hypothetical protein
MVIDDPDGDMATHESAHCYGCWATGGRVEAVTIQGPIFEKGGFTVVAYATLNKLPGPGDMVDADVHRHVAGCLFPIVYEERMEGRGRSWHDAETAVRPLSFGRVKERSLLDSAMKHRGNPEGFYAEVKPFLDGLLDERAMKCIAAGGQALKVIGRMAGREITQIFEETCQGDLPEGILPAEQHGKRSGRPRPSAAEALDRALECLSWAREILESSQPLNEDENDLVERLRERILSIQLNFGGTQHG